MPLTPFHLGPALLLGLVFFSALHLPTFLTANVIVDLEPAYALFFCPRCELHGFFHSFLGGSLAAITLAIAMLALNKPVKKIMRSFELEQKASKKSIFSSALLGVWLHVFLDSLLYSDMQPLYPSPQNPFHIGLQALAPVYGLCAIFFILGFIMYARRFKEREKNKGFSQNAFGEKPGSKRKARRTGVREEN